MKKYIITFLNIICKSSFNFFGFAWFCYIIPCFLLKTCWFIYLFMNCIACNPSWPSNTHKHKLYLLECTINSSSLSWSLEGWLPREIYLSFLCYQNWHFFCMGATIVNCTAAKINSEIGWKMANRLTTLLGQHLSILCFPSTKYLPLKVSRWAVIIIIIWKLLFPISNQWLC